MDHKPSFWIKSFAKFIDLLCSLLIIPGWINIYRFLNHKPTLGLKLFGLKFKNRKEDTNLSFKQSLCKNFTYAPFLLSWSGLIASLYLIFMFLARFLHDELWLSAIALVFTISACIFLLLALGSGLYRLFGLSFSDHRSKTEIVYDK